MESATECPGISHYFCSVESKIKAKMETSEPTNVPIQGGRRRHVRWVPLTYFRKERKIQALPFANDGPRLNTEGANDPNVQISIQITKWVYMRIL